MKRNATIGLIILFFLSFIGQLKAENINNTFLYNSLLAAPSNDECSNATSLTVNQDYLCTNKTAGTLFEATASAGTSNFCTSLNNANDDVWFKFVATAVSHKLDLLNVSGNQTDLYHMVYDGGVGGSCPTTDVPIQCSSSNASDLSGLIIGNTYIIRVFSETPTAGWNTTFDVCIGTSPPPPANDDCANAEAISSLPFSAMYDASSATNNSGSIVASGCVVMNDGVWYTLIGNGGDYTITVTPTGWNAAISVYSGSCGSFTCVTSSNVGGTNGIEAATFTSILNTTYYINIGGPTAEDLPEGIFNLDVTSVVLSIEDIVAKGFYYYPNPVENVLKLSANESIEQISLYSNLGREIKRSAHSDLTAEMDLSNLASGTYFVRVDIGDSSGSFKIIKK
jgi:hypothetical protein